MNRQNGSFGIIYRPEYVQIDFVIVINFLKKLPQHDQFWASLKFDQTKNC